MFAIDAGVEDAPDVAAAWLVDGKRPSDEFIRVAVERMPTFKSDVAIDCLMVARLSLSRGDRAGFEVWYARYHEIKSGEKGALIRAARSLRGHRVRRPSERFIGQVRRESASTPREVASAGVPARQQAPVRSTARGRESHARPVRRASSESSSSPSGPGGDDPPGSPRAAAVAQRVVAEHRGRVGLDAVERIVWRVAPDFPAWRFGAVLGLLPASWQPILHRDADRLVAEQAGVVG